MKYVVTLAGREVPVTVAGTRATIEGVTLDAHLSRVPGIPLWHVWLGGRCHTVAVERWEDGRWCLGLHGERIVVEALDERAHAIRRLAGARHARPGGGVLRAPMPGLVVRVAVAPGDRVAAGAGLVVLEAMKMENELRAATASVVEAVRVKPGEPVEKGTVLVELSEDGSAG